MRLFLRCSLKPSPIIGSLDILSTVNPLPRQEKADHDKTLLNKHLQDCGSLGSPRLLPNSLARSQPPLRESTSVGVGRAVAGLLNVQAFARVAEAVQAALQDRTAPQIRDGRKAFALPVWCDKRVREDLDGVRWTPIGPADGLRVALGTLADVTETKEPPHDQPGTGQAAGGSGVQCGRTVADFRQGMLILG